MSCMYRSTDAPVCMCDAVVSKGVKIDKTDLKLHGSKLSCKTRIFLRSMQIWLKVGHKEEKNPYR